MSQSSLSPALPGHQNSAGTYGQCGQQYVNPANIQRTLSVSDAIVLIGSLTFVFNIALGFLSKDAALIASGFLAVEAAYVCIVALRWIRVYDLDFLKNVFHGALAASGVTIFVGGGTLLFVDTFLFFLPPGSSLAWIAFISGYFLISRFATGWWTKPLAASGAFRQRVAIVGGGDHAEDVIRALDSSDDIDVEIVGMFDSRDDDRSPPVIRGYKKIGRISDILTYATENRLDLVIVTIPMTAHARLMQLLPKLWQLPVDVRICGQAIDMKLSPRAYTFLGRLPLLTVFSRSLGTSALRNKQITDKLIAAVLIAMISPLMLVTALAVLFTSRGHLLATEQRIGFDGKPIDIFRFRTRHISDQQPGEASYTLVGRWIETASLHEMPELFNVLKGDLSIVGPAIHKQPNRDDVGLYEKVADSYCMRHGIKPGLVGWAQIHGFGGDLGSPEMIENRVKYDLEYVDRFSWTFDLRILIKTPFAWLRNKSPQYVV